MKRLIIIFSFLLLITEVNAQIVRTSSNYVAVSAGAGAAPEMLSNTGFDSGTSWDLAGGINITGGVCSWTADNGRLTQTNANMAHPILNSTSYTLTFTVSGATGDRYIYIMNAASTIAYIEGYQTMNGNGLKTFTFTTVYDIESNGAGLLIYVASADTWSIDNISLKAN